MKLRYQYRIYPTQQQQYDLARLFGCCRVVYNDALALCKASEKLPSNGDLQKICITQAKRTDEREWLSEVSNIPLQQSVIDYGDLKSFVRHSVNMLELPKGAREENGRGNE